MIRQMRLILAGGGAALSLCLLLAAGCNQNEDAGKSAPPSGGPPGGMAGKGPGGGPGGPGGGPGGPGGGAPIAADATGEQIYQTKCIGCHGENGKGARGPALASAAGKDEDALIKIVHDGKERMPAFGTQLSDDQIKKVVAAVKSFK